MIRTNEMQAVLKDDLEYLLISEFDEKASILVIDDNHINLIAASHLLSEFGLICETAISGAKGIKLFKQRLEMRRISPNVMEL